MADDHAGLAVEAGEAADDGLVIAKIAVAMQLFEVREHMFHVIKGIRPLGMTRDEGDLPRRELAVDVLGQGLALDFQAADLFRDIHRRIVLDEAQLLDLGFQLGHRLFEFEKGRFHGDAF